MEVFYCYILFCSDGTCYTGWTSDLKRRVKEHNAGRGARYTRSRTPVKLAYAESMPDQTTAMRRERSLKSLSRKRKLNLIASNPWQDDTEF